MENLMQEQAIETEPAIAGSERGFRRATLPPSTERILGINFSVGDVAEIISQARLGGLVVAPAAPLLVDMAKKPAASAAIQSADMAVTDSGYLALLWKLLRGRNIQAHLGPAPAAGSPGRAGFLPAGKLPLGNAFEQVGGAFGRVAQATRNQSPAGMARCVADVFARLDHGRRFA